MSFKSESYFSKLYQFIESQIPHCLSIFNKKNRGAGNLQKTHKILTLRWRENPSKMRLKVKFYYFFGFTAIRFRLTDAMHPIQRALESPDLEEYFQYQTQCEKIKKKFLETF